MNNSLTQSLNQRKKKWAKKLGGKALWTLEKAIEKTSRVGNPPFFDSQIFDWAPEFESHWEAIRDEMQEILNNLDQVPNFQDISTDQKALTQDNKWKTFFLYGFGYKAQKNCEMCPETTRLIERIPGMSTAFFSILAPGKHIPPHRGVYKGFIRYHLGLKVPQNATDCKIRVKDQYQHWEEGQSLVFDDTYEHEVWNNTGETRVVLFMDIIRPLRFPGNLLNTAIIGLVKRSSFIQDAKKNQEAWEKNYEQILP